MLLCGFYEKEITPPLGGKMPGSFTPEKAVGVKDKLYVRAAAFETGDRHAIIISVESLFLPDSMYSVIVDRIEEYTGIKEEEILISATHSHTAGAIIEWCELDEPDRAYMDVLSRWAADCGILAFQNMKPAKMHFADTKVHGITFNRNHVKKDGALVTNPSPCDTDIERVFGEKDEELSVLYFTDEEGRPFASIANFACHNCCVGGNLYSGDYAEVMSQEMKRRFGYDFINLFINGCCGNLNHLDIRVKNSTKGFFKTPRYVEIGKTLADEAAKLLEKAVPVEVDTIICKKERFEEKVRKVPAELLERAKELFEKETLEEAASRGSIADPESDVYTRMVATQIFSMAEGNTENELCVQVIKMGEFMLYAMSGECYAEFGLELKKKSPVKFNMVAELSNGGYADYVPTKEAYGTQLYEAQLCSARLESTAGYKMVDTALKLAKETVK